MPRVVTGEFKGAVLQAPKGDGTRPTTDKVKEALFSMLMNRVEGAAVLDIFAGTGQIGIEAVSRGAARAVMVERSGQVCGVIRQNLAKIHAQDDDRFAVMKRGYAQALREMGESNEKFDIIFMDPPYREAHKCVCEIADLINRYDLLNEGGIVVAEHQSDLPFDTDVINLQFNRSCCYGLTMITFLSKG